MDKNLLTLMVWLLFLGGLFGMTVRMIKYFGGGTPAEYGIMGNRDSHPAQGLRDLNAVRCQGVSS